MSSLAGSLHQVWIVSSTVMFGIYRSVYLDRIAKVFIPEHTRDAAFQLFCDLRTNTPKDAAFLRRHATALKPRTCLGWLAATAFTLCASAYAAAAAAIALGIAVALINVILVLSVLGGVTLAIALSCTGVALFVGACVAGSTAFTVAVAYTGLESAKVVTTTAGRLLLGGPCKQQEPASLQLESIPRPQALEGGSADAAVDGQTTSEEQEQLQADVAAAEKKAADVVATLPGAATPAARYAMQKLGLALQDSSNEGSAAETERRPLLPVSNSSANVPLPAPPTPPETSEAAPHNVLSFLSPTKKRRAASPDSNSTVYASPPQPRPADVFVDASSSTASDSSQAPDLQGFMDQGFMGSPPSSRSSTPARQRAVAAA